MNNQYLHYIQELVYKKRSGLITEAEEAILQEWERSHPDDELILNEKHRGNIDRLKRTMYDNILTGIGQPAVVATKQRSWLKYAVAASLFAGIAAAAIFYQGNQEAKISAAATIVPGYNQAVLILNNGQKINLTGATAGKLASQQQTTITKTADGQIIYQGGIQASAVMQYNTISTPRGGQWPHILLPDGTRVMLDAASSIRYPVEFKGKERVVELVGQAYFEVKHDASHPFKIKVGGTTVEDIGTAFNVDAYPDEGVVKTTLVDGSVRVMTTERSAMLIPGQQATIIGKDQAIAVNKINLDEVTAWKNGQTSFKGKTVEEIMRQVSRWYDVDIVYEGTPSGRRFTGGISRSVQLPDLIKVLEYQDLHLHLDGKKIIINP